MRLAPCADLPSRRRGRGGGAPIVGLTLGRSRRDFHDDERDLMELMRPHLALAIRSLAWRAVLELAVGLAPARSRAARAGAATQRRPRVVLAGRTFEVTLQRDLRPGLHALQLREQARPASAESLVALGLTPRQAAVVALAADGWGAAAIAAQLGISRRTVEKHLEGVYAALGVHGRTEAIAGVRRLLGD